jgi:phage tail-like protein
MIAPAAPTRLSPLPEPPHDPRWLRLDSRAGWRLAESDGIEPNSRCGTLELARHAASRRKLTESSGSFGGLVSPANVAIAGDGSLYLLARATRTLLRFDPCACAFELVPCFGGAGDGSRRIGDVRAIAIHAGDLYVCDAGDLPGRAADSCSPRRRSPLPGRVTVWALPEMTLRGVWTLAAEPSSRPGPWQPTAIAVDGRGRVWVADQGNGMLHRFDRGGRFRQSVAGIGVVRHLAIDCRDQLCAVVDGTDEVQLVSPDGRLLPDRVDGPESLRPYFPSLPFKVSATGLLDLRRLCAAEGHALGPGQGHQDTGGGAGEDESGGSTGQSGFFDLAGTPVPAPEPSTAPLFVDGGGYLSQPLDSKLYRCQWHRILLEAEVPAGTRVQLSTYTAEAEQSTAHVRELPESAWATLPDVTVDGGEWDALIRSEPGRYLWLRLRFAGSGTSTPCVSSLRIEFPRISLRRYLPAVWGEDTRAGDFTDRFLAIFDTTVRGLERRLDTQAELYDPLSAPTTRDPRTGADFLSWLAGWIGVSLDRQWTERRQREYLKQAARGFSLRGTREGLHRQLVLHLGMRAEKTCCRCNAPRTHCSPRPAGCAPPEQRQCSWQPPPLILEHYRLRRWLFLGSARLGEQAVLWGQRIVNRSQLSARGADDRGAQAGVTQLVTTPDPLRDPFHVHAHRFSVFVPAACAHSPERRRSLENLLSSEKPAHTVAQIVYVEPRFRIGFQSMIGLDSVVGRYPEGVTLGERSAGGAAVLSGGPAARGSPTLRVGETTRVGTTAVLD